ncbi:MAG TPA: ABC transporter ATP-binding protein, partial [Patescibacteria group bacterium]|nr:ABC transporter ATP-binding protein [Patescibacteria group bacterium]
MIGLLRTYLAPYKGPIAIALLLLLVGAIGNLYLPDLNAEIIDNGVVKGDTDYILRVGALMLVVTAVLGVASVAAVFIGARVAMGFGRDVRRAVFSTVETFSQVEVNHFGAPSLITRNTNDVQQVQTVVFMGLTVIVSAPILIVGGIIMAVRTDPTLSALLIVILPLMALVIGVVMSRAIPMFRAMQTKIDRINQVMRETLAGVRVIRAFVRTPHEEKRFETASADLFDTTLKVGRLFAVTIPIMTAILNLSTVAVMWFGAQRVADGAMQIGALTAFLQYLLQIMFAVLTAVFMFILIPRGAVSAGRINEVLQTESTIHDPAEAVRPTDATQRGVVEFRNVEFRYPGAEDPVLRELTFRAAPGETTAIVGSTGSGKSTLINLIPRFYDVTGGQVLIDGVDVREQDREDLWRRIALVPQKAFLFGGTIRSNLRFGDAEATDEQLWRALTTAQARDFVAEMPDGLDSTIAQGGSNVSGGQRQRLAIARAIVRDADIVVFDDSFSALDVATDARLRAALAEELHETTVIIVAQRVATIMRADRIIVLDSGRIVGIGTHR